MIVRKSGAAIAVTLLVGALLGALSVGAQAALVTEQAKLTASDPAVLDFFGRSVAVSGSTVVVGAAPSVLGSGAADAFKPDGSGGHVRVRLAATDRAPKDWFGWSVAISGDTIVVGAPGRSDSSSRGSAYVFKPDGVGGYADTRLMASDPAPADWFGNAVAISGDTIVVGAPGQGSAYVFIPDGLGGYTETKLTPSSVAAGDLFGFSVAVSGDTVVVSASSDDAPAGPRSVYVFKPDAMGGYAETKLTDSDVVPDHLFGNSVGISGDTIVVGSPADLGVASRTGSAYVFRPDGLGGYTEAKLTVAGHEVEHLFGWSVAATDGALLVGAPADADCAVGAGSAYLFELDGSGGYAETRVTASDGGPGDVFGASVAISGDAMVVGAICDSDGGISASGSAYVFTASPTVPGAPTIGTAAPGHGEATVSWTGPAWDGGAAITGYVVTPYIGYYPLPSQTFGSTATTQVVTGLTNGTTYRFRVQATNSVGTGLFSKVTNPVTPSAPTASAPPTIGSAVAGNGKATVSWTAPASDGGAAITWYVVTPYIGYFSLGPRWFNSAETTQTVTGLANGTTYRFRVRAYNGVGLSGYSKVSNPVTPSA